ncbi:hypothetical protein MTO96_029847 [Rhipicephalus appendiculatus]
MTQSQAILRYLGRKHGLVPEDKETLRRVNMLQHEAFDILWDTARLSYDPDYTEDKRRQFLTDVADRLHHLEVYLDKHGPIRGWEYRHLRGLHALRESSSGEDTRPLLPFAKVTRVSKNTAMGLLPCQVFRNILHRTSLSLGQYGAHLPRHFRLAAAYPPMTAERLLCRAFRIMKAG